MPSKSKVSNMQAQHTPLSAHVIAAFFEGSDAKQVGEKIAALEGSRLAYLFRTFPASDMTTVKEAVKQYKADAKEKAQDKKIPKTVTTRSGEIQALYGAWRFCEFKPDGMGYGPAVEKARENLGQKGIKWDGSRIPEKWEKDVRKRVETQAQASLSVEMEREQYKRTHNGEEPPADWLAEKQQQASDALRKAGAVNMAGKLFQKQGAEFCGWLIESLESLIAAASEEKQEKQQQAA